MANKIYTVTPAVSPWNNCSIRMTVDQNGTQRLTVEYRPAVGPLQVLELVGAQIPSGVATAMTNNFNNIMPPALTQMGF